MYVSNSVKDVLSYNHLSYFWRKSFRNENWRRLNRVERALYMASLSLAKMRGGIVNSRLIMQLGCLIGKLRETARARTIENAYLRAMKLYDRYSALGLFEWAPQVKSWFRDPSFILWLGLRPMETR